MAATRLLSRVGNALSFTFYTNAFARRNWQHINCVSIRGATPAQDQIGFLPRGALLDKHNDQRMVTVGSWPLKKTGLILNFATLDLYASRVGEILGPELATLARAGVMPLTDHEMAPQALAIATKVKRAIALREDLVSLALETGRKLIFLEDKRLYLLIEDTEIPKQISKAKTVLTLGKKDSVECYSFASAKALIDALDKTDPEGPPEPPTLPLQRVTQRPPEPTAQEVARDYHFMAFPEAIRIGGAVDERGTATVFGSAAGVTDLGTKRKNNEDSYVISDEVDVVADGMGGHGTGEVASSITAKATYSERKRGVTLAEAIRLANTIVLGSPLNSIGKTGMGSTVVAAEITEEGVLRVAHVGDSRAYHVDTKGSLTLLTIDHSIAAEMIVLQVAAEKNANESEAITRLRDKLGRPLAAPLAADELPFYEAALAEFAAIGNRISHCIGDRFYEETLSTAGLSRDLLAELVDAGIVERSGRVTSLFDPNQPETLRLKTELAPESQQRLISLLARTQAKQGRATIIERPLQEGEWYLLCSDGLTGALKEELPALAALARRRGFTPAQTVEMLRHRAIELGAKDNVTVVIREYRAPKPAQPELITRLETGDRAAQLALLDGIIIGSEILEPLTPATLSRLTDKLVEISDGADAELAALATDASIIAALWPVKK